MNLIERREAKTKEIQAFGLNQSPDTIYRWCIHEIEGNCPYMVFNKYFIPSCSVDNIVQVRWYSCTPSDVLDMCDIKSNQLPVLKG